MARNLLDRCDEIYAAARAKVAAALREEDTRTSAVLLRWIAGGEINPHGVFSRLQAADLFGSAEDVAALLDWIDRAVRNGEICFPNTEAHGPYVHLGSNAQDPETPEMFLAAIRSKGHGEDVVEGHRVTGFLHDVHAFIAAFEAREREYEALYREFMDGDPNP